MHKRKHTTRFGITLLACLPWVSGTTAAEPVVQGPTSPALDSVFAKWPEAIKLIKANGFVLVDEDVRNMARGYSLSTLLLPGTNIVADFKEPTSGGLADHFQRYEQWLRSQMLPPLITTDALLHAYGIRFKESLRSVEEQQATVLGKWYGQLWDEYSGRKWSNFDSNGDSLPRIRGILAVGRMLMDPNWQAPEESVSDWVAQEVERVTKARGRSESPAWGRKVDYSVYRPRGLYTASPELQRYFRARVWLSHCPLRADNDAERRMAADLASLPWRPDWEYAALRRPVALLLGAPEDPDLLDLREQITLAYGDESHSSSEMIEMLPGVFRKLAVKFHPKIRTGDTAGDLTKPGQMAGVYILPETYMPCSEVLTRTTDLTKKLVRYPKGLDVMSALGSATALTILTGADAGNAATLRRVLLQCRRDKLWQGEKISETAELAYIVLASLASPEIDPNCPPFMKTPAYRRKSLQTALAGWAEYRNRWMLHGKKVTGIFGEDSSLAPKGFVEPNLKFWRTMLDLVVVTKGALAKCGCEDLKLWDVLALTVMRCKQIVEKQLRGQDLNSHENEFFDGFFDTIKNLCQQQDYEPDSYQPAVVVADIAFDVEFQEVVHVGTGLPLAMYAVYPWKGKAWLCKGAAMTYREYVPADGRRLTDERWKELVGRLTPPSWTHGFVLPRAPRQDAESTTMPAVSESATAP